MAGWRNRVLVSACLLGVTTGCFGTEELNPLYCDDPRFPGDGVSGLQCWGPPENYCKDGIIPGGAELRFCGPDGAKCCLAEYKDCHLCGWFGMDDWLFADTCRANGAVEDSDPAVCEDLWEKLDPKVQDCLQQIVPDAECGILLSDPECDIEPTGPICP